jgi:demethylmenaquinone methyltransferase/2-methoxy-6-polyprenyl-1,4-benzoquinol methylase
MVDTRTFYDRISRAYDLVADAGERACRDRGIERLDAQPGERVLEVGFGTGHALVALAAAVGSTGCVCGLDISSGMLTVARDRVEEAGSRNVILTLGDARRLCLLDATFDAAFMSFTLELFEPEAIPNVLAEICRVLRPGGRLGVVAMAANTNTNAMVEIYKWLHRHFPHFVDCRPIDLRGVLEHGRFQIVREDAMSMWDLPVAVDVSVNASSGHVPTSSD